MRIKVIMDRETDGRWIAEVDDPGVFVYGGTREDAYARAKTAALLTLSDLAENMIDDSIEFEAIERANVSAPDGG